MKKFRFIDIFLNIRSFVKITMTKSIVDAIIRTSTMIIML